MLRRSDGDAIIEFGISCIILIPMLFGLIEFSLAFYTYNFVSDAAREATRYAIVRGSTSCTNTPSLADACPSPGVTSAGIQSYVRTLRYPGLTASNLTATSTWLKASTSAPTTWAVCATPCTQPGNEVTVVVKYNFPIAIPFWRAANISLGSSSSMVIAQ